MTTTLREYFWGLRGKSVAVNCELQRLCQAVITCGLSYKYHFIKTAAELFVAMEVNEAQVNIIDLRYAKIAKQGTLILTGPETINFLVADAEIAARTIDNRFCFELNLDSLLLKYGLDIPEYPFSRRFFPSDIRGDPDAQDYLYLEALHDLTIGCKFWLELTPDTSYRLFLGKTSFTSWLARNEESGRCKSLYPLLKPFANKFLATQKVEYLQLFGWWVLNTNTRWAAPLRQGVTKYHNFYTVSISALALTRWSQLVRSLN